jgi:uncharacterized membrane protein
MTTFSKAAKILFFVVLNTFNVFIAIVGISYLHPDFSKGYLVGKEHLFDGSLFPAALYVHAFTAPVGLLLVSLLVLFRVEHYKNVHRFLGKTALIFVVFAIVPSGWVLSYYALGGAVGKLIFFLLASFTAFTAAQGYAAIRRKDISTHRQFMCELMALLASAVLLRLLLLLFHSGLDFAGDTAYNTAAILSWVPSIVLLKALKSTN